jgi:protein disulfide-isomerase A1
MKAVLCLCVCLFAFVHGKEVAVPGGNDASASAVIALTAGDFDAKIASAELTLTEFFSPRCGHCKQLAPEFEKAALELQKVATLASVDCTSDAAKTLCAKFNVRGYPTIKLFRSDGSYVEYTGDRTAAALVKYVTRQTQPAYKELTDADVADALLHQSAEVTVTGFFASLESPEAIAFIEVAKQLRNDFTFAVVTGELATRYSSHRLPSVMVKKPFESDKDAAVFYFYEVASDDDKKDIAEAATTTWSTVSLFKFIHDESFPLLGEMTSDIYTK